MIYMGVVEDINDPEELNRVRVRVFNVHSSLLADIPVESLPWSVVLNSNMTAGVNGIGSVNHGLVQGSWVAISFIDEKMQELIVLGSIATSSSEIVNKEAELGFRDPDGVYPKYTDDSDISKLSRSSKYFEHDSLKNKEVELNKHSFNLTPTNNPAYPNNKVLETTSGHVIEVDDTEGYERINIQHRSGSHIEMISNGDVIITASSNLFNQIGSNHSESVLADKKVIIKNNMDVEIGSGYNIKVGGDTNWSISGNNVWNISGDTTLNTTNFNINASAAMNVNAPAINFVGPITAEPSINLKGVITATGVAII